MKSNTNIVIQHILWRCLYFFSVLLLNIGISRYFAAEKSGQIFYILNNLAFVILLISLCLESGSSFFIASGKQDPVRLAALCTIWALIASLVGVGGWSAMLIFSDSGLIKTPGFIPTSFIFILGVLLTTYFTALFYAQKTFNLPNKILFFVNAALFIVLMTGKNSPLLKTYFFLIYFSCFFLQGLLLFIFYLKTHPTLIHFHLPSFSIFKKVLTYSFKALAANTIYFLVNRIDYWLVKYFCSGNELGNYIQVSKLAQMLFILPGILGATLFPFFSSGRNPEQANRLISVIRILLFVNVLISVGIIGVGWYLFPVLFGNSFGLMYILFVLIIPGILCVTMNYPLAAWFSANDRIAVNIRGSLLAVLVVVAGDLILLPKLGIRIASVVSSAGYFCYFLYTVSIYRRDHYVTWKDFFILRKTDIEAIRKSFQNIATQPDPENAITENI